MADADAVSATDAAVIAHLTPAQQRGLRQWLHWQCRYLQRTFELTHDEKVDLFQTPELFDEKMKKSRPALWDVIPMAWRQAEAQGCLHALVDDPKSHASNTFELDILWEQLHTKPQMDAAGNELPVDMAFLYNDMPEPDVTHAEVRACLDTAYTAMLNIIAANYEDVATVEVTRGVVEAAMAHIDTTALETYLQRRLMFWMETHSAEEQAEFIESIQNNVIKNAIFMLNMMDTSIDCSMPAPYGEETLPHDASGDSHGTPDTDVTSPSPIVLPPATYRFVGTFLITLANFRLMQREYAPELSLTPLFEAQLEEEKATEGKCVTIESIQSEIVKNVVDECLWKSGNTLHESSYVSFRSRFLQYVTFHPIWQARFIKDITNEIKSLQPIKDIVPEDLWTFTIHPHCQKLQVLLDLLPEILKKPSATPRFHALKVLVETSVKRFARLQATISKSQEDRQDSQDQQDAPDLEGPEDQESSEDLEGPEESSFQDHEPTAGEVCAQRKHEETENDALEDVLGVDTEILALRERFMELHDQLLQQIQRQSRVQFCVACLTNSPAAELKKLYLKLIQKGAETWSTPNLQEECHKREKIVFLQFAEAWDAVHQPKDTVGEETKDHLDVDGAAAATAAAPGLVSCQQYQGTDGAEEEEDLETRWNAWLQRANAQVCEVLLCDAKRQAVFTVLKKRKETSEVQTTAGSAGSAGSDGETEASEDEDEASADKSSTTGKSESSRQEECIIC